MQRCASARQGALLALHCRRPQIRTAGRSRPFSCSTRTPLSQPFQTFASVPPQAPWSCSWSIRSAFDADRARDRVVRHLSTAADSLLSRSAVPRRRRGACCARTWVVAAVYLPKGWKIDPALRSARKGHRAADFPFTPSGRSATRRLENRGGISCDRGGHEDERAHRHPRLATHGVFFAEVWPRVRGDFPSAHRAPRQNEGAADRDRKLKLEPAAPGSRDEAGLKGHAGTNPQSASIAARG